MTQSKNDTTQDGCLSCRIARNIKMPSNEYSYEPISSLSHRSQMLAQGYARVRESAQLVLERKEQMLR